MRALTLSAAVALALAGLAGCTDYLERRDGLALGAGDAVQTNLTTQLIDPWPAGARQTRSATDGARVARAVQRYRNPSNTGAGSGQSGEVPPAPAAAGSPSGFGAATSR